MQRNLLKKIFPLLLGTVMIFGVTGTAAFAEPGDNPDMFRKDVSKTPDAASAKAKLNVMGIWFPVYKANGSPATYEDGDGVDQPGIAYYDENGDFLRSASQAKPLVITYSDVTYTDEDGHEYADVFASVSRDDGNSWKRKNISRMADLSSFDLANGKTYYGHCRKPVMHVKSNKIFVTWSSKYARGGKPRYAIKVDDPATPEVEDDYPYDDPYFTEDIWGVAGSQKSVDYADYGMNISYPEVGEVPYSVVWCVRGIIATKNDVEKGLGAYVGDLVWFKPERLTSGRRDAYQLFAGGSSKGDFGIVWQEDPNGLFPGKGYGPGSGWGGARTNKGTDIWYSFITYKDFAKVDKNFVAGGDPDHDDPDFVERPKALVPMSLPVRITDNQGVNTKNAALVDEDGDGYTELAGDCDDSNPDIFPGSVDDPDTWDIDEECLASEEKEGTRRYITELDGLWCSDQNHPGATADPSDDIVNGLYSYENQQGELVTAAVTCDGRLLDGDTGASRPNLFLQPYLVTNNGTPDPKDDVYSAWAIMGYEEAKGLGAGPPDDTGTGGQPSDGSASGNDEYKSDEGKNNRYTSFDFQFKKKITDKTTGEFIEFRDMTENELSKILVSDGDILNLQATDLDGNPLWLVEEDLTTQILDIFGEPIPAYQSAKRVRFILQGKSAKGSSNTTLIAIWREGEEGRGRCADIITRRNELDENAKGNPYAFKWFQGIQNMSSVTIDETYLDPEHDPTSEDPRHDGTKVIRWHQEPSNLSDHTARNPYDDARAMRGQIRGDNVLVGYVWTPNYYAASKYNDKYDFYIRKSFDGGQTWTTGPTAVEHIDIYQDPTAEESADKHYEVVTTWPNDTLYPDYPNFEPARNVSLLRNNKESVIEPRTVACPGTIKKSGVWTGIPEDKQNKKVCYLLYGLEMNDETQAPTDLFWSLTKDWGQTLKWVQKEIKSDSSGNNAGEIVDVFDWLAKEKDAEEGEAQIRMTPSGERMYVSWLEEFSSTMVLGDLDSNDVLDLADFFIFLSTFAKSKGQPGYNAYCDYNGDDCITFADYQQWYSYYLQGGGPETEVSGSDIKFRRIMDPMFPGNRDTDGD